MIHAVCDFCGKDCGRSAIMLTLQPFSNFARSDTDAEPYGSTGPKRCFVMCSECINAHELPNPYHHHHALNAQSVGYEKCLHNYDGSDLERDLQAEADAMTGKSRQSEKGGQSDG